MSAETKRIRRIAREIGIECRNIIQEGRRIKFYDLILERPNAGYEWAQLLKEELGESHVVVLHRSHPRPLYEATSISVYREGVEPGRVRDILFVPRLENTCGRTGRMCIGGAWDGRDGLGVDCSHGAHPHKCPHYGE